MNNKKLFRKIYKNAFDYNGNFKSFNEQYKDYLNGRTYRGEKLLISLSNEGLEYANIRNAPLEISEHAMNAHEVPRDILENLDVELKNGVMALDSISRPELDARIIVLNKYDSDNNPYIAAIHQKNDKEMVDVNKLSSIYGKKNIQNFIEETLKSGGNVYKNKKTDNWMNFNRLQLPRENISSVSYIDNSNTEKTSSQIHL